MDKDFIKRQTLVWLEVERMTLAVMHKGKFGVPRQQRELLAESLTNHLVNNWQMVERARALTLTPSELAQALRDGVITRDTPEHYDSEEPKRHERQGDFRDGHMDDVK